MDHGDGFSLLAVHEDVSRGQCGTCVIAKRAADRNAGHGAEYVDDDVAVVSGPEFGGFVVVPRLHVHGLGELSVTRQATVLAAVQRATRWVREKDPWSEARIVVLTDLPGSEGHMCIRVCPVRSITR